VIVVDTNVITYLWLSGDHTESAERALRRDPDWSAPLLWRSEFRNVLAGYLRRDLVDLAGAVRIAEEAEAQMRGREFAVPASMMLDRAAASGCSAYDCEFVVLAEELSVPLVTTDAQVLDAFPSIAQPLAEFG